MPNIEIRLTTLRFTSPLSQLLKCKAAIPTIASLALIPWSITASAQEAPPEIINQETGSQVNVIRAYWNANVDIANRRIQCDYYEFNQDAAAYKQTSDGHLYWIPREGTEFFHNPLTEGGGGSTIDHAYLAEYYTDLWNVKDGNYSGFAPLANSPFVEMVGYSATGNASDIAVEANAVRVWLTSDVFPALGSAAPAYHLCYDVDGASFLPTGSVDTGNTDLLPEQNFTFQLPPAGTPVTETPEIIRLDTGEPVEFVRAEFDYNGDLKGKRINCGSFSWNEESVSYRAVSRGNGSGRYYTFNHSYIGGETISFTSAPDDLAEKSRSAAIETFLDSSLFNASFIEIVDAGYNIWSGSSGLGFQGCRIIESFEVTNPQPFAPNRIVLTANGSCDYSDADLYDGWGWNAATQQGCPPEKNPDYVADEENADGQVTDTSTPADQTIDVNNATSEDNATNGTNDQLDDGTNNQVENDLADTASDSTGNDSTGTDSTDDQSGDVDNTQAQTSGSGAADKFLLLLLICFIGRGKLLSLSFFKPAVRTLTTSE